MKIKLFCLLSVCICQPLNSYAQSYLFPTDVLEVGKIDTRVGVGQSNYEADFSDSIFQGAIRSNIVREIIQARYGIAPNWHVGVALTHDSSAREKFEDLRINGSPLQGGTNHLNKNHNLELFAKYQWIADKSSPYSLASGFLIAPSTTNLGMTYALVNVAGGYQLNTSVRAYAAYEGRFTDRAEYSNSHAAFLGLHYRLNDALTIAPELAYRNYESTERHGVTLVGSRSELAAGLSLLWQVLPNTYVIPSVALAHVGSYQRGILRVEDTSDANTYAISLYHLF